MSSRITIVFVLVAGFIGGAMSHYLFVTLPAQAQAPAQPPAEIRARKFVLVDENGTARGMFGFQSDATPAIQASFVRPKGLAKLIEAEVGSARQMGVDRKKSILPDLRPAPPPKANPLSPDT
jgi:hypothetical protein